MELRTKRLLFFGLLIVVSIVSILFVVLQKQTARPEPSVSVEEPKPVGPAATSTHSVIGHSVHGRPIEAYTYGSGPKHLLFVGGMHGGYEWNSVLLAYEVMDHLTADPTRIPDELTITIIPDLNPDGVYAVIGKEGRFAPADVPTTTLPSGTGRFNADNVDLNRNFDCKWKPTSKWQGKTVSAGTAPFSEPEAQALRDYVLANHPAAVVFWHSQSNAVYASECTNGILPGTRNLMNLYATAAHYPAVDSFNAYPVTGDSEGWLASVGIPAITVELSTHATTEWDKNLPGVEAVLGYYETEAKAGR